MKRLTVLVMLALAGCGGKAGNPIASYQPGDPDRTCEGLLSEISANEAQIGKLRPGENATGKNVVLGVTGAFLLVPLFFIDTKDGERIEIEALERRNLYLREVASEKGCS